ncbi:MAG: LicD family protein, partial [Methanobrevibacter sp.]|nr:LicD family protein [Methanobrevibacter sp.]
MLNNENWERIQLSKMNTLQSNLYQLLVEFDELCRKYDVEYLLAAGASLGAVRNRSFMPWDDDIDLYITR